MNINRFIRLLNDEQSDWIINHINHNPITKVVTLNVNHIGSEPGKMRALFRLDQKFARKQAAGLIKLARKYGSSVVPKFKRINVKVI